MPSVYCESCGFKSEIKKGKSMPKKCQYCDSKGTVKPVKTAQDLLDEVSRLK